MASIILRLDPPSIYIYRSATPGHLCPTLNWRFVPPSHPPPPSSTLGSPPIQSVRRPVSSLLCPRSQPQLPQVSGRVPLARSNLRPCEQRSARNQGPAGAPRRRCLGCHGYSSWPPFAASSSAVRAGEDGLSALSRCIFCNEPELSPAPKPLIVAPESACQTLPPLGLQEQPEPWTGASRCHGALPPAGFSAPRARSVHPQPPSLGSRLPCPSPPVRRPWPSSTYSRHGSRPRCFPDSFENVRSVRIRSTTSRSSTSRISCFMDSFFFQAGSQQDDHFPGSHYYHCHARCLSFIVSCYLSLVV